MCYNKLCAVRKDRNLSCFSKLPPQGRLPQDLILEKLRGIPSSESRTTIQCDLDGLKTMGSRAQTPPELRLLRAALIAVTRSVVAVSHCRRHVAAVPRRQPGTATHGPCPHLSHASRLFI